jgi:EAL domain-containing protein (putative c-di-GMP-specific phosphodiesterase class I)
MEPFSGATDDCSLHYLDHYPEPGGVLRRTPLTPLPFLLGRDATADLVVYCPRVSKAHAAIAHDGETLAIEDLGSTNGTFVNGRRVKGRVGLCDGDIIHLASKEFRFGCEENPAAAVEPPVNPTEHAMLTGVRSLFREGGFLRDLIQRSQVTSFFQPIVSLADRQVRAYEALGRGRHDSLPHAPGPLLALAQRCRLTVPLSRAFRVASLAEAEGLPAPLTLFLNVHPDELRDSNFVDSLPELHPRAGDQVVLEVHEDFMADVPTLQKLRARLSDLGVGLAYDDFGVGQARLSALTHAPADYVKLDRSLVQTLPHSQAMRDLVRALVRVCRDLGTQVIAEGLESENEVEVSQELGCQLGQGYLFGRPKRAADLAAGPLGR